MSTELGAMTVQTWTEYLRGIPWKPEPQFEKSRYVVGKVDDELADRVLMAMSAAPIASFDEKAYRCAWSPLPQEAKDALLFGHSYRALTARLALGLGDVLDAIAPTVSACLRAPWRVLNVRNWFSTLVASGGPYEMHRDGEPLGIFKIMLYWTDVGGYGGGLEVDGGGGETRSISGPAGTWVLFYNSSLMHRAIAPKKGMRAATEITLCPWPRMDAVPRTLGANARHPIYPIVHADDRLT